jgi:N-acetylglucosaminyl-diphospho-decaprenol L-rhamnosyltransferase
MEPIINTTPIDVSIVIISWKMRELLKICLDSIYKFTNEINFEIIVIDNDSQDGTPEMIEKDYKKITLLKNSANRGVAPARNQGIRIAKGRYILILDADMEFKENSIAQIYDYMEKNQGVGLLGCKLVDSANTLQYSCKRYPNLLALVFRRLEHYKLIANSKTLRDHIMKDWDHNSIKEVDYVIGACQYFRRKLISEVGLYDDKIFYGPEDMDYCLRIWRFGSKVVYYPFTSIFHHEQRITKKKILSKISIMHLWGIFYIYWKYKGKIKR